MFREFRIGYSHKHSTYGPPAASRASFSALTTAGLALRCCSNANLNESATSFRWNQKPATTRAREGKKHTSFSLVTAASKQLGLELTLTTLSVVFFSTSSMSFFPPSRDSVRQEATRPVCVSSTDGLCGRRGRIKYSRRSFEQSGESNSFQKLVGRTASLLMRTMRNSMTFPS